MTARDDAMTIAMLSRPLRLAGVPAGSWAFGIRIWLAVVLALAASFWLELEVPSTAAVTVAILAEPTRGRALEKACSRLIATVIGVTAAIVIVALFSQARDLLLAAFAGWIGLCVYTAGMLDGNRAYAAVLSGYSVGIIAIQQIDAPDQVFQSGMERGAAIAVGVAAIAMVNDLLAAPDNYPQLASRLAALHLRVGDYAKAFLRDAAASLTTAAGLLGDIAALRPEIASLAMKSANGSIRSAAARSTAVALVAQVHAVRVLSAVVASTAPAMRTRIAAALDQQDATTPICRPRRPHRHAGRCARCCDVRTRSAMGSRPCGRARRRDLAGARPSTDHSGQRLPQGSGRRCAWPWHRSSSSWQDGLRLPLHCCWSPSSSDWAPRARTRRSSRSMRLSRRRSLRSWLAFWNF